MLMLMTLQASGEEEGGFVLTENSRPTSDRVAIIRIMKTMSTVMRTIIGWETGGDADSIAVARPARGWNPVKLLNEISRASSCAQV